MEQGIDVERAVHQLMPHILGVPLRLLVLEKEPGAGQGTRVVYDLPSSLISPGLHGDADQELRQAAEDLDSKLEKLIQEVTQEWWQK